MTQDFAKQKRSPSEQGTPSRRWPWFITGLVTGSFITFLAMLWFFVDPKQASSAATKPIPETESKIEEMQWDFYEIFPKSVVPIVQEYTDSGDKIIEEKYAWTLQAGSFRKPEEADELRATLILMGLPATTNKIKLNGEQWFRVVAGPFETDLAKNRAQDKLAQALIESLAIKIPR